MENQVLMLCNAMIELSLQEILIYYLRKYATLLKSHVEEVYNLCEVFF
ncbi:hypothetical protein ME1_00128 [Bartonella vinsonii subsp. arupensis OK-94-513]|uniref:Uncharacterized protein n=2 Tax=Bartonella vinsonii subsp. arupensis TaxID=110578 RepID=J0ZQM0_BARVI|nr:hypothetical protein ME1_00128 [Bartonella vinsonii subsp. arupensis OK-94-513]EJF97683.1 hypothetical protein MEI_01377 [Bartonella vinsonii subsp. arupensis Pm136co]